MSKHDHNEPVECAYQIMDNCQKVIPPHEGVPHSGFVDPKTRQITDEVKWCCIECEMAFDED